MKMNEHTKLGSFPRGSKPGIYVYGPNSADGCYSWWLMPSREYADACCKVWIEDSPTAKYAILELVGVWEQPMDPPQFRPAPTEEKI